MRRREFLKASAALSVPALRTPPGLPSADCLPGPILLLPTVAGRHLSPLRIGAPGPDDATLGLTRAGVRCSEARMHPFGMIEPIEVTASLRLADLTTRRRPPRLPSWRAMFRGHRRRAGDCVFPAGPPCGTLEIRRVTLSHPGDLAAFFASFGDRTYVADCRLRVACGRVGIDLTRVTIAAAGCPDYAGRDRPVPWSFTCRFVAACWADGRPLVAD